MPKSDIDAQIRARVESFVDDLTDLIRASALDSVREALGSAGLSKLSPAAPRAGRRAKAAAPRKGKRIRRSSSEVERLAKAIAAHVKANPGQRLGEIAKALGLATKDARRPAFSLVEAGVLRTEGVRGGTRYYAGGRAASTGKRKAAKRKVTKKRKAKKRKTTKKRGK